MIPNPDTVYTPGHIYEYNGVPQYLIVARFPAHVVYCYLQGESRGFAEISVSAFLKPVDHYPHSPTCGCKSKKA